MNTSDLHNLRELQRFIKVHDNHVEILNAKFHTNIVGTPYVIAIDGNGSPGVQTPIGVDGTIKCIICQEITQSMVCEPCAQAVRFARVSPLADRLKLIELLEKAEKSGLLDALTMISIEDVKGWMDQQIEEM